MRNTTQTPEAEGDAMRRINLLTCLLLVCSASIGFAQEAATAVPEAPVQATAPVEETAPAAEPAQEPPAAAPEAKAPEAQPPAEESVATEVEIPAEEPEATPEEEPAAEEAAQAAAEEEAVEEEAVEEAAAGGTDWAGLVERAPAFFAVMHRAAVHMPIALWMLGAFFVLVGVVIPSWRNQIPLACLIGGMLTGVGAAMTGWWNAQHEWGDEWAWADLSDADRFAEPIVQHRWIAVALVVSSVILSILALISQRKKSRSLGAIWRIGLLLLAAGVAWEGHLGGEMTVGEGYMEEAFETWVTPEE